MSNTTRPQTGVDQRTPGNVIALFTEVVLDSRAIHAERLALLAELVAEQFTNAGADAAEGVQFAQLPAAQHVECAAQLARAAAEREQARRAAAYGVPGTRSGPSVLTPEPVWMAHLPTDPDHLPQRSMAVTREIDAVVREIRELFAVQWDERHKRWQARRVVVEARQGALVAECQDIAAMRARQHDVPPPDVHYRAGPPSATEVER